MKLILIISVLLLINVNAGEVPWSSKGNSLNHISENQKCYVLPKLQPVWDKESITDKGNFISSGWKYVVVQKGHWCSLKYAKSQARDYITVKSVWF